MADVKNLLQWSLSPATWSQYGKVYDGYETFATSIMGIPPEKPILPFQAVGRILTVYSSPVLVAPHELAFMLVPFVATNAS